jgi:ammonia channel protein AmtB
MIIFLFVLNIGFGSACTAGILLPLKYTIGIRLSPEDELRGLDFIGKLIYLI